MVIKGVSIKDWLFKWRLLARPFPTLHQVPLCLEFCISYKFPGGAAATAAGWNILLTVSRIRGGKEHAHWRGPEGFKDEWVAELCPHFQSADTEEGKRSGWNE